MRHAPVFWLGLVLGLSPAPGCKRLRSSECDRDALDALAARLDGMTREQAAEAAARGVSAACPDKSEPWVGPYLEQAASFEPQPGRETLAAAEELREPAADTLRLADQHEAACPGHLGIYEAIEDESDSGKGLALYRRCKFQRFEVLEPDELDDSLPSRPFTWALHQWMLDERVSEPTARAITRALLDLDRKLEPAGAWLGNLDLPEISGGAPLEDDDVTLISVTPEAIVWPTGEIALRDGHRTDGLTNAPFAELRGMLGDDEPFDLRLPVLAIDGRIPFSTLVDVAGTAVQSGHARYGLVTGLDGWRYRVHEFEQFSYKPAVRMVPTLGVDVRGQAVRLLALRPGEEPTSEDLVLLEDPASAEQLEAAVAQLRERLPGVHRLELAAEHDVPTARLFAVYEIVRGRDCAIDGTSCWVHDAVLTADPSDRLIEYVFDSDYDKDWQPSPEQRDALIGLADAPPFLDEFHRPPGEPPDGLASVVVLGEVEVIGPRKPKALEKLIRTHLDDVRRCHEQRLASTPDLAGELTVQFAVLPSGEVPTSVVQMSTLKNKTVGECSAKLAKKWTFPAVAGEATLVSVTFTLSVEQTGD